jgi:hypothetical protein
MACCTTRSVRLAATAAEEPVASQRQPINRADDRGGCDVASCVGTPIGDDKIELEVEQGETYFLVVGARDEAAPFTLDVRCIKD